MKSFKLAKILYSAFAWAMFTLGAAHLGLVIVGKIAFAGLMFFCGGLYVIFLLKSRQGHRCLRKEIIQAFTLTLAILLLTNALYSYVTLLHFSASGFLFLSGCMFPFVVPLLLTIPFLRKDSHVTQ